MLKDLLNKQIELNKKFNGDDWETVVDIGKLQLAIFTEISEYLESNPSKWKWWKVQEDDIQNSYIELIDILHFSLSYLLMKNDKEDLLNENIFTKEIHTGGCLIPSFYNLITKYDIESFYEFFDSLLSFGNLSESKVIELYNMKNKLNHDRVDGGYMIGVYNKYIDGVEDNKRIQIE